MPLNKLLLDSTFEFHSSIIGEPGIAHIHHEIRSFTANGLLRRNPKPNSCNTGLPGEDAIEYKAINQHTENGIMTT
jgi:hypothetical protein